MTKKRVVDHDPPFDLLVIASTPGVRLNILVSGKDRHDLGFHLDDGSPGAWVAGDRLSVIRAGESACAGQNDEDAQQPEVDIVQPPHGQLFGGLRRYIGINQNNFPKCDGLRCENFRA